MKVKQKKLKAFLHKYDPRMYMMRGVRKVVGGIYTVSDRVKDKLHENTMALDNPFSAKFYADRCNIQ